VRFLVGAGWPAHWLDFIKDRLLPPMPKLLEAPFCSTRAIRTSWPRQSGS
jgi:hypothetical protein